MQKRCTTFVCDRRAGEGSSSALQDQCCRSQDGAPTWGMEEMAAEKTEVVCHTDCLALLPSFNRAHLFRIHVRQVLRTGGTKSMIFKDPNYSEIPHPSSH